MDASADDDLARARRRSPTEHETPRESELIRAAQAGSADAAEALVRRHWLSAHRAAYLIVNDADAAEDICQEALLAALDSIERVDPERPFGAWLHRIVVNGSLDWVRSRTRRREIGDAASEHLLRDASAETAALSPPLVASLQQLTARDRTIVVLRHLFDYDSKEVGSMLGMRPATVRTRLRRALEQVRVTLDSEASP